MSFIVVQGREDQEQADAVLRGVADGLASLFPVPDHPRGVQDLLDARTQEAGIRAGSIATSSGRSTKRAKAGARRGGDMGPPPARAVKTAPAGALRGSPPQHSRTRARRARSEAKSERRDQS